MRRGRTRSPCRVTKNEASLLAYKLTVACSLSLTYPCRPPPLTPFATAAFFSSPPAAQDVLLTPLTPSMSSGAVSYVQGKFLPRVYPTQPSRHHHSPYGIQVFPSVRFGEYARLPSNPHVVYPPSSEYRQTMVVPLKVVLQRSLFYSTLESFPLQPLRP